VRTQGVAGNWQWWAFTLTGVATVFFYARLWRRSGVLTDLEFYELRYSGNAAKAVRGFRAVYLGFFFNCFIMASVNLAACKIAAILFGFERVANPRKLKLITQSLKKNDRMDAEQLARLARVDPKLLSPIQHRGEAAQGDLAVIRARAELVDARTGLINTARGLAKPMGERLKKCDADYVKESMADELSAGTQNAIRPLLKSVEDINKQIAVYNEKIQELEKRYPEAKLLKQVHGVGILIAITYILVIEDASRFTHSRDVGPYVGLTRKQRDSGESRPELGISKAGDELLRRLLVQGAHCVLRDGAPECDLKAWGRKLQGGGKKPSKSRKKKAVVAVARKLAVLLHRLWVTGEVYDPQYNRKAGEAAKAKGKVAA
jgi:transposase